MQSGLSVDGLRAIWGLVTTEGFVLLPFSLNKEEEWKVDFFLTFFFLFFYFFRDCGSRGICSYDVFNSICQTRGLSFLLFLFFFVNTIFLMTTFLFISFFSGNGFYPQRASSSLYSSLKKKSTCGYFRGFTIIIIIIIIKQSSSSSEIFCSQLKG